MNNIKRIRLERNISQKQLASASNVSSPYLYDLENGHRNARPETWERIAAALNCTVEELTRTDREAQ